MLKKYKIIKQIGEGTFSSVFIGKHHLSNENVAIKIETLENENTLNHECKILLYLSGLSCIPTVRSFGVEDNKYRFLVMDYYEKSLQHFIIEMKPPSPYKIKQFLFNTIIDIIKLIHQKQIIHRDIKPANFMIRKIDLNNLNNLKIVLIDFGLATVFIDKEKIDNENIEKKECFIKEQHSIIGTPKYISTFIHNGYKPTYIDDLISACYIGIFIFRNGILSWDNCDNNYTEIYRKKCNIVFKEDENDIELCYNNCLDIRLKKTI